MGGKSVVWLFHDFEGFLGVLEVSWSFFWSFGRRVAVLFMGSES